MAVNAQPPASALFDRLLRPLVLAVMALCVAVPLTQVLTILLPGLHSELLLGACLLATLESNFSYGLLRARFLSGWELWRFRLVELGFLFLVIRAASLALNGWPAELGAPGSLPTDVVGILMFLFDVETFLSLALAVLFAFAVGDTLSDLERVGEAPFMERHYVNPVDSLTSRFMWGGVVLLALSGLARIGLAEALSLDRPPVTGLVLNVLVFFVLGLFLLGRANLARMTTGWQARGLRVAAELPGRWMRYSLAFIALAALLAFALPTSYTSGALGMLGNLFLIGVGMLWYFLAILLSLLMLPVAWLMSRLFTASDVTPLEPLPPPPTLPPAVPPDLPAWIETLRPVLIWGIVLLMLGYVLVSYLRDRPELVGNLRQARFWKALKRLWAALRHRAAGLAQTLAENSPLEWLRRRRQEAAGKVRPGYFRLGGASPRDQIRYYYLSMLRRANERGLARRPNQTPREFEPHLAARLPEAEADVEALSEAFIEARYSAHPATPEQANQVKQAWRTVRQALRKKD